MATRFHRAVAVQALRRAGLPLALAALLLLAAFRVHEVGFSPVAPTVAARATAPAPRPSPPLARQALARHDTRAARVAATPPAPRRRAPAGTPAWEVDRWVDRLTTTDRAETQRALARMHAYRPLVFAATRKHGIPDELIYLALIESSFRPAATSGAGAAGVWQFMPATAAGFGLEVGPYVDERRDPVRATDAAARYLAALHRRFGSWHLAAAAYNAGEGRVQRALRTLPRGSRDPAGEMPYWIVRHRLPAETRAYVPKLLAVARIGRDPEAYGFSALAARDSAAADPLAFRLVSVPGDVSLARVAATLALPAAELRRLNPHLVRGRTPPGRRWAVRVPATTLLPGERSRAPHPPLASPGNP